MKKEVGDGGGRGKAIGNEKEEHMKGKSERVGHAGKHLRAPSGTLDSILSPKPVTLFNLMYISLHTNTMNAK